MLNKRHLGVNPNQWNFWGWNHQQLVKSVDCFYRELQFDFQHLCGAQNSL